MCACVHVCACVCVCFQLWNYNNGQCLIRLTGHGHDETVKKHESKREITALMVASLQVSPLLET